MSPVLTRRAALPAAAAPVAPRPGCAAEPVKLGPFAALPGGSAKAIARGLLARLAVPLTDRCAVRSSRRVPRTGPARAVPCGLEDAYLGATAA